MRIERTGPVEPLTPRLIRFLEDALGGKSADKLQSPNITRVDYACLNGLLAVEVKSLMEDASERMDNLTRELRERDDWPIFLGSAPMEAFIRNTSDPNGLRLKTINRVGRAIVNHIKKADDQLEAHAGNFPRKNLVRAVLLINEDHEIYDPETVGFVVQHSLRREKDGRPLYPNIDCVIYMTERHAGSIDNRVAFPILAIESPVIGGHVWKEAVIDRVVTGWADWTGQPLYSATSGADFATIDHIPEIAPRHERWRLDYRRNPYMRSLTNEQVREKFDESIVLSLLHLGTNAPLKPSFAAEISNMEKFTHIMVELANRAIPVTALEASTERNVAAGRRLGLNNAVLEWLASFPRRPEMPDPGVSRN